MSYPLSALKLITNPWGTPVLNIRTKFFLLISAFRKFAPAVSHLGD